MENEQQQIPGVSSPNPSKPRGFAVINSERQRQIASLGGKTAHARGNAHKFTPEEAREAGRKGGEAISRNREYMRAIGRKGGEARSVTMQLRQSAAQATIDLEPQRCNKCGCTDEDFRGCVKRTGQPCRWVRRNLCSACVEPAKVDQAAG